MKHLNIRVEGDVQGVGFRWSARSVAGRLGIRGFVRNEPDGSVYIEAEGEEAALDQFMEWCRRGPGAATVERVTVTEGPVKGSRGFDIRF